MCFNLALQYFDNMLNSKNIIDLSVSQDEIIDHMDYCKKRVSIIDIIQTTRNPQNRESQEDIVERIKRTIVHKKPTVTFNDVCGLDDHIKEIKQAIIMSRDYSYLFKNRTPLKSFLFYGPPGTGKTLLAKAVAAELNGITFFNVSSSSLISKYQGESEQCIRVLIEVAQEMKPSVIFIDELDSIGLSRNETDSECGRRIKTEILIQMEALKENSGVFIISATNTPYSLDIALLRRFDKLIYVTLPDKATRYKMLKNRLEPEGIDEKNLEILSTRTEGFAGSDIEKLCKESLLKPISRLQNAKYFRKVYRKNNDEVVHIPCDGSESDAIEIDIEAIRPAKIEFCAKTSIEDVNEVLRSIKPITSKKMITELDKFASEVATYRKAPVTSSTTSSMPWYQYLLSCGLDCMFH